MAAVGRTRAGTRLTADYKRRLQAEAEAGFDVSELVARPVGRPSLSGREGQSHRFDLRVDDQTYQAVQQLARRQKRRVSDVVRDAIKRYLEGS
jgi:hypothetical protein